MRTVWKGSLSFGLVNVPVSLVAATERSRVSFRQLHAEDHAPVKHEKKCSRDGAPLSKEDIVKGVEVAKDRFVIVTDDEIAAVEPESSRTLTVKEFVDVNAIDPTYHDRAYALTPQPGGERAYALLFDALSRRSEAAIGKLTMRRREHLVAVRAGERFLFADLLHYAEEVRDLAEIEAKVTAVDDLSDEERQLADVLLDRLRAPWDPARYEDVYEQRLRELVNAKAEGASYVPPAPAVAGPTKDLLSALRATLEASAAEEGPEPVAHRGGE